MLQDVFREINDTMKIVTSLSVKIVDGPLSTGYNYGTDNLEAFLNILKAQEL